jgi:large subunit ribosomal protein L9
VNNMKVILLQDVKKVGKKGDVVDISDGYARNFLFPRKLAEEANNNNMHILNTKKENERKKKLAEIEAAQKLASELKGKEIKIEAKSGNGGRLFGAITSKDVAELINKQFKLSVDKKKIVMDTIKVAGSYDIEIKLYPEVSTKMKVIITPQS